MRFYPFVDPFNTDAYADFRRSQGQNCILRGRTYVYERSGVAQVFYPMEEVKAEGLVTEFRATADYPPGTRLDEWTNTVHVPLGGDVFGSLAKDNRWGVKKAKERGVETLVTKDPEQIWAFGSVYDETAKRNATHRPSYTMLYRMMKTSPSISVLVMTKVGSSLAGAHLFLISDDVLRFFYGGFLTQFSWYHVNEAAHWRAIELAVEAGCKVYDMGGIGREPPPGSFKLGWGKLVRLNYYTVGNPFLKRVVKSYRSWKLWRSRAGAMDTVGPVSEGSAEETPQAEGPGSGREGT